MSILVSTVMAAATLAVTYAVAGPAPTAHALDPFDCPNVYSLQGASPRNIWEVDVDTGTQSSVGSEFTIGSGVTGNLNGLGISADGSQAIGVISASSGGGRLIYGYDRASDSTTLLGSGVNGTSITHGAIDPATGIYYYGGVSSGVLNVYGFDPVSRESLGRVAHGPIPNNGSNGDFAFDRQGRLYVVAGDTGNSVFSVVNQQIPSTATDIEITATKIADIPAPQPINGIGYSGSGYLYVSSSNTIYQINPSTGAVVTSRPFSEAGSVDLASCATPNTIIVQKDFPGGRAVDGHQATVSVTGGGLTQGNTGTTTGTDSGLQNGPGEMAGPVLGLTGTTYTISETGTGTNAGSYTTSWRCVDENNGDAVVAQGAGTDGSFTMPDGGSAGAAIVCTFTNDAKRPAVSIDKEAGPVVDVDLDGLTDAGDTITYSFVVTNSGNLTLGSVAVLDPKVGSVDCPPGALEPGQSKTCTAPPYVLTQTDVDRGAVDNRATATGDPVDPTVGAVFSTPDTTHTSLPSQPRLVLDKIAAPPVDANGSGLTDANDTIDFTFHVVNRGNVTITQLRIADPEVATVNCPVTVLGPGEETTCTAPAYSITTADELAGQADNTAVAHGVEAVHGADVESLPDSTSTPVQAPAPDLTVEKDAGAPVDVNNDGLTNAGDTIAYTFTVTNSGDVPLRNVTVVDPRLVGVSCADTSLAPDDVTTCSASPYTVTTGDELAGSVVNTAVARGDDPDGEDVTSDPDSTRTVVTPAAPELRIEKGAGDPVDVNSSGITDAGDTIQYTFTVHNDGNVTMTDVVVDDDLAGPVTCEATTLAPGGETTCAADEPYVITAADETAEIVTNTATTAAREPGGDLVRSDPDSTNTPVTPQAPALTLDKEDRPPVDVNGSGLTDAGDTIRYTFRLTNEGNVPLSGLTVVDPLAGAVTCAETSLPPTRSTTCTADEPYVIQEADEQGGEVVNVATALADDPDGDEVASNEDSTTTEVQTPAPELTFDKQAGTPVDVNDSGITDAGDTIAFTFTVSNAGNVPISSVRVIDPLAGPVSCEPTTLLPGESALCAADAPYVVTEADEAVGSVDNTARATGEDPDGGEVPTGPDSTSTPVTTPEPVLTIDKEAGTPVDVNGSGITDAGDTIAYTFTVANEGNVPINGIVVTDPKAGDVTCEATRLEPGTDMECAADALYVVTEADEAAGSADNTARARGVDPDGDEVPSDPDSTSTTVTTPEPVLTIDKEAGTPVDVNGSGITDAGDTIAYTFTVVNEGNVPISDVVVVDPKVGAVTCDATALAVGASTPCSADQLYVVTEADEAAGSVDNTARATGTDPDGDEVPSDPDSTSTTVTTPDPVLTIDKVAGTPVDVNGSGITDAGDTIAYTFTVSNDGNVPITGIEVDDPRVGDVTCAATRLEPGTDTECVADALYVVAGADETAGSVDNTARATGTDPDGGEVPSDPDTTSTTVTAPDPILTIDKEAGTPVDVNGSGITDAGDTIAYSFTVSNDGNVPITDVSVVDPMVGSVTCDATTLAPGATTECAADEPYVITAVDEAAEVVTNTATVGGTDPDGGDVESDPDSTNTPTTPQAAALTLEKHAGTPVDVNRDGITDAGDTIRFSFTLTNDGNVPLAAVAVTDPMVGAVTCEATTLAPGESTECAADEPYVVTAADQRAGEVLNEAGAGATDPDGDPVTSNVDGTTTEAVAPQPGLELDKEAGDPVDVNGNARTDAGDTILYTFTVTNTGNVILRDVEVRDRKIGRVVCRGDRTLAPGQTLLCGARKPYVVTATDVANGSVDNTASATADLLGRQLTSPDDTVSTPTGSLPEQEEDAGNATGALPDAGGPPPTLLGLGIALLTAGALLLVLARRRRADGC